MGHLRASQVVLSNQVVRNESKLGLGLRSGNAGREACDCKKIIKRAVIDEFRVVGGLLDRNPELDRRLSIRKPKTAGHYSNHRKYSAIEYKCLADNVGIRAKQTAPKLLSNNDDARCVLDVIGGFESAAQQRRYAERLENSGACECAMNHSRFAVAGERHISELIGAHARKRSRLTLPVKKIWIGFVTRKAGEPTRSA